MTSFWKEPRDYKKGMEWDKSALLAESRANPGRMLISQPTHALHSRVMLPSTTSSATPFQLTGIAGSKPDGAKLSSRIDYGTLYGLRLINDLKMRNIYHQHPKNADEK